MAFARLVTAADPSAAEPATQESYRLHKVIRGS
jgi:hypothetical protein